MEGPREGEGSEDDGNNRLDPILQAPILIEAETMEGPREGEDDGNVRPFRLDPFLLPPILEALFEQMPVEDLAKCRLVSKLWCDESLSTWRSKATLKFGRHGIVATRDDDSRRTISIGEFLDRWVEGEWGSCPFKQFELVGWDFEDVEQQRFLVLVGGHVTSLTLESCSFVGRENFRRIIYQVFPKLQFLKMNNCAVDCNWHPPTERLAYTAPAFGVHGLKSLDISGCVPHPMMDMLSHFHMLKSLHLRKVHLHYNTFRRKYYLNVLETIRLIRAQDQSKLPLKNFAVELLGYDDDGQSAASSTELQKLHEQLRLPMQRLRINFKPEEACNFHDVIRDILQNHSSTLKHLYVTGYGVHVPCKSFPFGFPLENDVDVDLKLGRSRVHQIQYLILHKHLNLPRLTWTIDFYREKDEDMDWDFNEVISKILRYHSSSLKYLEFRGNGSHGLCKSFPYGLFCLENLEKLTIDSPCFIDNLNYLMYTPKLRVLEIGAHAHSLSLSMADSDNLFSNSTQLEIGDWRLPSLMDLKLGFPLSLWNVTQLMKWMPNLERLWGLQLDDVTFSMVCENWRNLKYLRDDGNELTDAGVIGIGNGHESGGDDGSPSPATITKLKNLLSFVSRSSKLTSASVHEGFLKLTNLERLFLGSSTKFDDEAKAALERRKITFELNHNHLVQDQY